MNKAHRLFVVLLCLCVLLLAGMPVSAQAGDPLFSLAFLDADQCAPPGGTITYFGSLTNLAQRDLMIERYEITLSRRMNSLDVSHQPFLLPVAGYTGELFSFKWDDDSPPGFAFTGTFRVTLHFLSDPARETHSAEYTARVCDNDQNPVPEPSGLLALLGGLPFAALSLRRRRQ